MGQHTTPGMYSTDANTLDLPNGIDRHLTINDITGGTWVL